LAGLAAKRSSRPLARASITRTKRSALAIVALCLVAAPIAAAPQLPPAVPTQQPQFRAGVELVALNVSVESAADTFITDLQPTDFAIFENGAPRKVKFFGPAALPIDVALLVDVSGSMGRQMPLVRRAALGFIQALRPQDRAAIVGFAERITLVQTFTGDRRTLVDAVARLRPLGSTALYDVLYIAADQFLRDQRKRDEIRRQAIVVLSDGQDSGSLTTQADAFAAIQRTGCSVYVIAPIRRVIPDVTRPLEQEEIDALYMLRRLARETGGRAFFLPDLRNLTKVYSQVSAEIRQQYTLAFEPDTGRLGTRLRQLLVQVVTRPNARVRTRTTYDPVSK
jgi:Ca-activated chloride channel family protein